MDLRWVMAVLLLACAGCACAQPEALAAWEAGADADRADGLRLLSGADGEVRRETRDGSVCAALAPNSGYMYFDVLDGAAARARPPLFLEVEYFDDALGGAIQAQYDSDRGDTLDDRYRYAEGRAGGQSTASRKWRTMGLELRHPRWRGGQNLGADFRLTGAPLYVRRVVVWSGRPAAWERWAAAPEEVRPPLVRIGPGGEFIVGGFDTGRRDDLGPVQALDAAAPAMKQLGVTSHEAYVRWNLCEIEPGKYDWSVYDRYVDVYRRHGLKWVPFLIVGPAYSLPEWYFRSDRQQGYVCLEHGEESHVQSLWNPAMRGHVARFLKAFGEHYRDSGVVEGVLLGITGNYGEAIYIASGNDWTADVYGEYHTHPGFWAGDPYAVKSFRGWLAKRYRSVSRLNAAWGADYASFDAVQPMLPEKNPHNNRAKLDFVNWYTSSMNEWAEFWMTETRRHMPKAGLYLCTGGHAPAEHGADFGEQCRIAAKVDGGVRITNEASAYPLNFSLTRWVASASRQYGNYASFEPAGEVNPDGVVARIYNATASGVRGLHYYHPNLFGNAKATENFIRYGAMFTQRKPVVEVFVYYPQTDIKLNGQRFLEPVQQLRDRYDFGYMSDNQIRDGGLKGVKAMVMLQGTVAETETWQRILAWVRAGGLLLYADGIGALATVEGREPPLMRAIRGEEPVGKGRVARYEGPADAAYMDWTARTLAQAPELGSAARAAIAADGKTDGLFATLASPDTLLWLNGTDRDAERGGLTIPARGMAQQALTARRE